jgi:protease-4
MRNFFKMFGACLLALVIFSAMAFFFLIGYVGGLASKSIPRVKDKSVLVLDLSKVYQERKQQNPFGVLYNENSNIPGLYDLIRIISEAKNDKNIEGIFIMANANPNGFAASEEIRDALKDFKTSKKFVLAYGDVMSQTAYAVASIADKVYINPQGHFQWTGFNVDYVFLKGTLEKLEVEPQIFYAGKFKSATEPLRTDKMTPENQYQTSIWLNDLYDHFLGQVSEVRKIDTATLRKLANDGTIQTPNDAFTNKLVDSLKYDDQVKDEIKRRLGLDKYAKTSFVTMSNYLATKEHGNKGGDKIALIVAEGNIMDGDGDQGMIGGDTYRSLIRKLRLDKTIKAIVLRVNSGGGSSLASENIWRELELAKEDKPVIVSFGDVAASGGYYIATCADSIFAQENTITGSIGVFSIIPNMQSFFKNKLGVTFDGVQTGPYADIGAIYRPLSEDEKKIMQTGVELTYTQFKERVAQGRKKDTAFVDSIAQGRVWTGIRAKDIGLIDRIGGINDAIRAAAAKAKITGYQVKMYPEQESVLTQLFGGKNEPINYAQKMKEEIGENNFKIYTELKNIKQMTGTVQARLPFQFFIR